MATEAKKETIKQDPKQAENLAEMAKLKAELKELKAFKDKFSEPKKASNQEEILAIKNELKALKDYKTRTEQWEQHLEKGGKKEQKQDFMELLEKGVKVETINKLLNTSLKAETEQSSAQTANKQQITSEMVSNEKESEEVKAINEADNALDKKKSYSTAY